MIESVALIVQIQALAALIQLIHQICSFSSDIIPQGCRDAQCWREIFRLA